MPKPKEESKLKWCPICGKQPRIVQPERGRLAVECPCGLSLELTTEQAREAIQDALVAHWNRRS